MAIPHTPGQPRPDGTDDRHAHRRSGRGRLTTRRQKVTLHPESEPTVPPPAPSPISDVDDSISDLADLDFELEEVAPLPPPPPAAAPSHSVRSPHNNGHTPLAPDDIELDDDDDDLDADETAMPLESRDLSRRPEMRPSPAPMPGTPPRPKPVREATTSANRSPVPPTPAPSSPIPPPISRGAAPSAALPPPATHRPRHTQRVDRTPTTPASAAALPAPASPVADRPHGQPPWPPTPPPPPPRKPKPRQPAAPAADDGFIDVELSAAGQTIPAALRGMPDFDDDDAMPELNEIGAGDLELDAKALESETLLALPSLPIPPTAAPPAPIPHAVPHSVPPTLPPARPLPTAIPRTTERVHETTHRPLLPSAAPPISPPISPSAPPPLLPPVVEPEPDPELAPDADAHDPDAVERPKKSLRRRRLTRARGQAKDDDGAKSDAGKSDGEGDGGDATASSGRRRGEESAPYSPAEVVENLGKKPSGPTRRIEVGSAYGIANRQPATPPDDADTAENEPRRHREETAAYSVLDATAALDQPTAPRRKTESSSTYSVFDRTQSLDDSESDSKRRNRAEVGSAYSVGDRANALDDGDEANAPPSPRRRGETSAYAGIASSADAVDGADKKPTRKVPFVPPPPPPTGKAGKADDGPTGVPAPRPKYGQPRDPAPVADAPAPVASDAKLGGAADLLAGALFDDDDDDDMPVAKPPRPAAAKPTAGKADDGPSATPAPRPKYGQPRPAAESPDAGAAVPSKETAGAADLLAGALFDDDDDDEVAMPAPRPTAKPTAGKSDEPAGTPAPRPAYGQPKATSPADAHGSKETAGAADLLAGALFDDDDDDDLPVAKPRPAAAKPVAGKVDDGPSETPAPRPKYGQPRPAEPAAAAGVGSKETSGVADLLAGALFDDDDDDMPAPSAKPATPRAGSFGDDDDDDDLSFLAAAHQDAPAVESAPPARATADDESSVPAPRPKYGQPKPSGKPAAAPKKPAVPVDDDDDDDDLAFLAAAHQDAPAVDSAPPPRATADDESSTPAPRPKYGQGASTSATQSDATVEIARNRAASDSGSPLDSDVFDNDEVFAVVKPPTAAPKKPAVPVVDDDDDDDLAFLAAAHESAPAAPTADDAAVKAVNGGEASTPAPRPRYGQPAKSGSAAPPAKKPPVPAADDDDDDDLAFLAAAHESAPMGNDEGGDDPAAVDARTLPPRPTYGRSASPPPAAAPASVSSPQLTGDDDDDDLAFLSAAREAPADSPADAGRPAPRPTYGRKRRDDDDAEPGGMGAKPVSGPGGGKGPSNPEDDELAFLMSARSNQQETGPPDLADLLDDDDDSPSGRSKTTVGKMPANRPRYTNVPPTKSSRPSKGDSVRMPARRPTYNQVAGVSGPTEVEAEASDEPIEAEQSPYGSRFTELLEEQLRSMEIDSTSRKSTVSAIMGTVTDAELRAYSRSKSDVPPALSPTNADDEAAELLAELENEVSNEQASAPSGRRPIMPTARPTLIFSTPPTASMPPHALPLSTPSPSSADMLIDALRLTPEEFELSVRLKAGVIFDEWMGNAESAELIKAEAVDPVIFDLLYGRLNARKGLK